MNLHRMRDWGTAAKKWDGLQRGCEEAVKICLVLVDRQGMPRAQLDIEERHGLID